MRVTSRVPLWNKVFQLIVQIWKLRLELRNFGKPVVCFENRSNHLWSNLLEVVYRTAVLASISRFSWRPRADKIWKNGWVLHPEEGLSTCQHIPDKNAAPRFGIHHPLLTARSDITVPVSALLQMCSHGNWHHMCPSATCNWVWVIFYLHLWSAFMVSLCKVRRCFGCLSHHVLPDSTKQYLLT
jgi:hypothetical protein